MTHAFSEILERRQRRKVMLGRALYMLRRSSRWLVGLVVSSAFVLLIAGFAEARGSVDSRFDWPGTWLPRLVGGDRPISAISGALLVVYCGAWLTIIGIGLLRLVLRMGYGPLAIARSVLDEAVRNKTVVVLLGLLLLLLAAWPYSSSAAPLDVRQPLRYQIQSFLSFSSMALALLLGAVTILFSAYSVSQDINVRRTGDVFVKPISRWVYLLGKWLGVVSMMAVILAAQIIVIYGVSRFWLGTNIPMDGNDAAAVNQHVLIARGEALPMPPVPFTETARQKLEALIRDRPDFVAQRGPEDTFYNLVYQERNEFMSIPFGTTKKYLFVGLQQAKRNAEELERRIAANRDQLAAQLSDHVGTRVDPSQISLPFITPYAGVLGIDVQPGLLQWRFQVKGVNTYGSAWGAFDVRVNGRALPAPVRYTIERVQVRDLPASYVNDDGTLILEIANVYSDSQDRTRTIQFDSDTWVQIYHVQGDFAPNLVRGGLVHLVRLAFLAMLGVAAGSLWSYPVAATFSLCVWMLAAGGQWLQDTLTVQVADTDVAPVDIAFNDTLLPILRFFASFLSRYSEIGVASHLVDGRYISYAAVGGHTFWIGVVWMGVALSLGGWLFSRRELARVQV